MVVDRVNHEHDWMSVNEVARRTGRTRQWVHHRIQDGTLTCERKGRRIDIEGSTVTFWMLGEVGRLEKLIAHLNDNMPL